ncbi:PREDICTED: P protein isoform X1 [Polistes dominula]|uniref:P protein isoform X1 n=2 Tax=Polistes dominula TaxID=743375 RepID=A0ABM1J8U0_POLDO|nr:PREDICTED: P protein isoform X1 [Polistes dominula]
MVLLFTTIHYVINVLTSVNIFSLNDSSEDETDLRTPMFLRKGSKCSRGTPGTPSSISSSIIFGPIPDDVLRVWSQLPEAIRLDPSLAIFQKEYDRIHQTDRRYSDTKRDCLVVNMSLGMQPAQLVRTQQNIGEEDTIQDVHDQEHVHEKQKPIYRYCKLIALSCIWLIFTVILMVKTEKVEKMHQISISSNEIRHYILQGSIESKRLSITVEGSLLPPLKEDLNLNLTSHHLKIWLSLLINEYNDSTTNPYEYTVRSKNISNYWILPVLPENLMDLFPAQKHEKVFELCNVDEKLMENTISINLCTDLEHSFPLSIAYDLSSINTDDGIPYAAVVLFGLYILIVFEIVHRALAAMLASTMSVAILAAFNERPNMTELISWIDIDTLLLLFSMMVLVAIVAETGIFDWLAVYAYRITGGKLWPLVNTLCFFTTFISSFLDNVTTVLLMTPVTIRLCEVMELNPVPILTAMVVYSNIGGAITPVGDPPNVIIASNRDVIDAGVDFSTFTLHMSIGVILVLFVVYAQMRFIFRDKAVLSFDEPREVQELRHEIAIWQRAAASLSSYSKDENLVRETLLKKVQRLLSQLKKKLVTGSVAFEKYKTTLEELEEKYPIRDKWLLMKSGFALVFVITLFFLHSVPGMNLSLGWTALLGVLLLLILADGEDLDGLMARVEWSTLLFFASLFILMEALSRLGLIAWIGKQTERIILSVNEESRLAVAILLILWVSAFASAFVDNVPLSTMMVRIAINLAKNHELRLPLQPLIWALAFGACMGGNGTLIGATANVVCAGVAEQHGYKFTFIQFLKVGFPVMITSTLTVTMYLMIAHVIFAWNGM